MNGISAPAAPSSTRLAASFRDPSGYVFFRGQTPFRAIDQESFRILSTLDKSGVLPKLMLSGKVVGTTFADAPLTAELAAEHPGFSHFLQHEPIFPITYPYEWSFSMLADAGILTLELEAELAQAGFALKDASAFNIQFVCGRPVFIDLTSVEKPEREDLWFALGQFQRMFLFPLLLMRHRGWDLRSYFLPRLDGRSVREVAEALGASRWRPRFWLDISLPALLEKKAAARKPAENGAAAGRTGSREAQIFTLNRLKRKLEQLAASRKATSMWAGYKQICTYDQVADASKKELVQNFLAEASPSCVLDLGCNTGDYSFLAAEAGAAVIAADSDHDAVDTLYRRVKQSRARITPLILDLGNPSPAIGYLNAERPAFLERSQADCIFALALIHHLVISGNLSFAQVRDLLARLTSRDLVLEFVPREDPMFQRLIQFRKDIYGEYHLERCLDVFSALFELRQREPLRNSPRELLFFRKKLPS